MPWEPGHHPVGRPTEYREEFCDQVVEAAKDGFSLTAFAGLVGVSRQTVTTWCAQYPLFLAACARAKAVRALSWEKRGIRVGDGNGGAGAAPMVQFALRNFAPDEWRDRQPVETTNPETGEVTLSEPDGDRHDIAIHVHFDGK